MNAPAQQQQNQVQNLEGTQITERQVDPRIAFRDKLTAQKGALMQVLPRHISFEKFQSVVMTACMQNPELLRADRPSLMLSCVKSATDGLLPDGRDAALVIFNAKIGKSDSGKDVWGPKVQYMPMYMGILKKVRQSGELSSINTQVVYSKDRFEHKLGDEDTILHEVIDGNDRGDFKAVYCIVKLKDGTVMKEVMYRADVEKVRKASKAGAEKTTGEPMGIWKAWYEEMAKKTVFRRLSKWLPQSIDKSGIAEAFANDESMEVIEAEGSEAIYTERDEAAQIEGQPSDQAQAEGDKAKTDQPDLKKEIAEKKEKSKKPEEKPTEKADPSQGELAEQKPAEETIWVVSKDGEAEEMLKKDYDDMFPADRPKLWNQ